MISVSFKKRMIFIIVVLCLGIVGGFYFLRTKKAPIPQYALDKIVKEKVEPISLETYFGGKVFCVYKVAGYEENSNIIKGYIKVWAQEFYVHNNSLLTCGSETELPTILSIKKSGSSYKFVSCRICRAEETKEGLKMFPGSFSEKLSRLTFTVDLEEKLKSEAKAYFKKEKVLK